MGLLPRDGRSFASMYSQAASAPVIAGVTERVEDFGNVRGVHALSHFGELIDLSQPGIYSFVRVLLRFGYTALT